MKFTEVKLNTHRFEAMKGFYSSLLGLNILQDQPSKLSIQAGETNLVFHEALQAEDPFYHFAFTIPTNKLAEAKQWLSRRGIQLFSKDGKDEFPFENWNADAVYFYDPDGNLVEFIAHHTLDNAAEDPFGPNEILRISEIGLSVDNVPEVTRKLNETFQINPWRGGGEQFAPVGDVEGLLIVVDKNRPWFPDGRLPAQWETSVSFKGWASAKISIQNGLYEIRSI